MSARDDISPLLNRGVLVVNPPDLPNAKRTIVVLGVPRGGTTLVAGSLFHLGIPMGDSFGPTVFEDQGLGKAADAQDWDTFMHHARRLNGMHDVWGWKRPMSYRHLPTIEPMLRNPRFVAVFRGPLAVGLRESISMKANPWEAFDHTLDAYQEIARFLRTTGSPAMAVSYEKAVRYPEFFLDSLRSFAGLPEDTPMGDALAFVNPESEYYLLRSHRRNDLPRARH